MWLRFMARARAPPCGELSRVARACRRRTATPGTSGLPWRTRASSRPRACCSARAAGRALELCHRGPGLSGKICAEKGGRQASSGHPDPPHSPGGRVEGAVDWGRGPGRQARESACGPVHTRACARVSARKRHMCSAASITGPREPRPRAQVGRRAGGGAAPVPAGASQPGRPPGPALAPASRHGSCPGPAAAPGCFWVSAPPRCLQGGRSSVGEKPSQLLLGDPANQSQPPTEQQLTGPTECSRRGSPGP